MAKTYGIGIMGAGTISSTYLRRAPLFKGIELRGVADIIPERSKEKGETFGVKPMTPEELLASPDIDVVVNLTPPLAHYGVSWAAITHGKHAYSEKPFALSLKEGKALRKEADKRGLYIGSAPDTFLGGGHQQVRQFVDGGQLGKITGGTAHVMSRGMEHWHPDPIFFFQPGGGPILDVGPYYVTNLIQLLGPVKRVTAFSGKGKKTRVVGTPNVPLSGKKFKVETPTTIHGVMEFESGAIVTIGASWDVMSHGHTPIELYGENGSIYVPDPNFFGGDITITDATGAKTKLEPWDHPFSRPNYEARDGRLSLSDYRSAGLAEMVQAIDKKKPARCGIDLALHAVDVMTSLLKSGETGKVITMTTTCKRPKPLRPEDAAALLKEPAAA